MPDNILRILVGMKGCTLLAIGVQTLITEQNPTEGRILFFDKYFILCIIHNMILFILKISLTYHTIYGE